MNKDMRFSIKYVDENEVELAPPGEIVFDKEISGIIAGAIVMACDTWWEAARDENTALSDHRDDRVANLHAFDTATALEQLIQDLGLTRDERTTGVVKMTDENVKNLADELNSRHIWCLACNTQMPTLLATSSVFQTKWPKDSEEAKHKALWGNNVPRPDGTHGVHNCQLCRTGAQLAESNHASGLHRS